MIDLKIISDGTCLRKSPVLSLITSDRTFCAASAKDEALCQLHGGSGLILNKENKWYLRGFVSASERPRDLCFPDSLVVFTDAAKFVSWIQSIRLFAETSKICGTPPIGYELQKPGNKSLSIRVPW